MPKPRETLKIEAFAGRSFEVPCEVLVLPMFKDGRFPSLTEEVDRELGKLLSQKLGEGHFDRESDKTFWVEVPDRPFGHVLLVSLGEKKELDSFSIQEGYALGGKAVLDRHMETVGIGFAPNSEVSTLFGKALEGFLLATYRFDKIGTKKKGNHSLRRVRIAAGKKGSEKGLKEVIARAQVGVEATCLARDWVNLPGNVVNPTYLTRRASEIAKSTGLKLKVFEEPELKRMGMNLILAVGMGSEEKSRLIHLQHVPKGKAHKTVVLVGKGVTFDTGGLSLKPQAHMVGMKADMAGAAAVLATMWAVSKLKLPIHVHAFMPVVENMPSHRAVRPGDVFVGYNGKGVEIENTDAEGRLILADALAYAAKLGADATIDLATLTGACVVALGEEIAGMIGNHEKLLDAVQKAGNEAGERFWPLPFHKPYLSGLKSDVADLKNVAGRYGGAISAGLFLSEFAGKGPWLHLDIAGPANPEKDSPLLPKGGTGFAVRTLIQYLESV